MAVQCHRHDVSWIMAHALMALSHLCVPPGTKHIQCSNQMSIHCTHGLDLLYAVMCPDRCGSLDWAKGGA
jgi:H+/gluconate symporter-like permease